MIRPRPCPVWLCTCACRASAKGKIAPTVGGEADRLGNREQVANYQMNLALAARGRGNQGDAVILLETSRRQAAALPSPYLQTQIDLWLAELYAERGEVAAARDALERAERRLQPSDYGRVREWAARVRRSLEQCMRS